MTCWYGCPSAARNTVRRTSCRPITSRSAAPSATSSTAPDSRTVTGVLYSGLGPSSCPMNHSRCCANDNGTRTGRGCGTSAARAACAPTSRTASPAGVGASNKSSMSISTPSTDRTWLASCIPSSECPPRAKKSSSGPTDSSPRISANAWHNSSRASSGPRPAPAAVANSGGPISVMSVLLSPIRAERHVVLPGMRGTRTPVREERAHRPQSSTRRLTSVSSNDFIKPPFPETSCENRCSAHYRQGLLCVSPRVILTTVA